jgi:hypothetical protein
MEQSSPRPQTLAERLGTTTHISLMLRKLRALGLDDPEKLRLVALDRGCQYYQAYWEEPGLEIDLSILSNEELAIALLHPGLPHDPRRIRLGAAMAAAPGIDAGTLTRLARMERADAVLRYIAEAGRKYEPENPFWQTLIDDLPRTQPIPQGALPHPTRFIAMTGFTRKGLGYVTEWIRPWPKREKT